MKKMPGTVRLKALGGQIMAREDGTQLTHPFITLITHIVASKKLPNVYKSCPKMISLEK